MTIHGRSFSVLRSPAVLNRHSHSLMRVGMIPTHLLKITCDFDRDEVEEVLFP